MHNSNESEGPLFSFGFIDPVIRAEVLKIKHATLEPQHYIYGTSACRNPFCDCMCLNIALAPGNRTNALQQTVAFTLDITKRTLQVSDQTPTTQATDLAKALEATLQSADWEQAERLYELHKSECSEIEEAPPPVVPMPPDFLEDPAIRVRYEEVFPFARPLSFTWQGQSAVVREHYCANSECSCARVLLEFLLPPALNFVLESSGVLRQAPCLYFDLADRSTRPCEERLNRLPDAAKLFFALTQQHSDLSLRLQRRQKVLRQAHAGHLSRPPGKIVKSGSLEKKLGRNDPCPCGSGKKHKKCCALK